MPFQIEADPEQTSRLIAFEQPLSERMRTFLRIESLRNQAEHHALRESSYEARAAVNSLLEILAITTRGDVRTDALKELDRKILGLSHYQRAPGVDRERLAQLMAQVDKSRHDLSAAGKQFLAPLRDNEFLSAIRHRSSIPGGTCMFDLPDYGYWLQLPCAERSEQLHQWLGQVKPLCDAIDQILWLTREASAPEERTAIGGLYSHSFGKNESSELVRVLVNQGSGLYPEISAGSHRFTVRFAEWQGAEQRARQVSADVPFLLAIC